MPDSLNPRTILAFSIVVIVFLWLDLRQHKQDKPVSVKNALIWTALWVSLAFGFAAYVGFELGAESASLFLTGYLLEESLSIDNLFVFMAIFASFGIKDHFQHRVLYYGIIGAIVFRLIFVSLGTGLLLAGDINPTLHTVVFTLFGLAVLISAWQMYKSLTDEKDEIEDFTHHWAVRFTQKLFPVHPQLSGNDFFVRIGGQLKATPLFLCLVVVEASDIAFAFDSVPAVIAVTREPFLIYTSNIFAILGLRSMYFLLVAARRYLAHLEKAVVGILAFIGVKLLLEAFHTQLHHALGFSVEISPTASLMVVGGGLALGMVASLIWPPKKEEPQQPSS